MSITTTTEPFITVTTYDEATVTVETYTEKKGFPWWILLLLGLGMIAAWKYGYKEET